MFSNLKMLMSRSGSWFSTLRMSQGPTIDNPTQPAIMAAAGIGAAPAVDPSEDEAAAAAYRREVAARKERTREWARRVAPTASNRPTVSPPAGASAPVLPAGPFCLVPPPADLAGANGGNVLAVRDANGQFLADPDGKPVLVEVGSPASQDPAMAPVASAPAVPGGHASSGDSDLMRKVIGAVSGVLSSDDKARVAAALGVGVAPEAGPSEAPAAVVPTEGQSGDLFPRLPRRWPGGRLSKRTLELLCATDEGRAAAERRGLISPAAPPAIKPATRKLMAASPEGAAALAQIEARASVGNPAPQAGESEPPIDPKVKRLLLASPDGQAAWGRKCAAWREERAVGGV